MSGIVAAGICASAMEMMDRLTIEAAEAAVHPGYPDAGAILLVELDGAAPQVEDDFAAVDAICRERAPGSSARRATTTSARCSGRGGRRRSRRWAGSRPTTTSRTASCPDEAARGAAADRGARAEYGLRVGNVFHAGDGNLHPLVLYDGRVEGEAEQARELAEAILEACIDAGGSLTGEHGIGVDKACSMPLLFGRPTSR